MFPKNHIASCLNLTLMKLRIVLKLRGALPKNVKSYKSPNMDNEKEVLISTHF